MKERVFFVVFEVKAFAQSIAYCLNAFFIWKN